ncbi:hypothetical protein ACQPZX_41450 [Actinoplanes sp. CA-142083]|uniref:hypothetical protein n=1 Tax=Actinoplanes sp. CA-142083 TaxID=3239903 RepID=UPI003D8EFB0D
MPPTRRVPTADPADVAPAAPAAPVEPDTQVEATAVAAQLEQAQKGLLDVIIDAVNPGTAHGIDINLARQAAEVHQILFGESR